MPPADTYRVGRIRRKKVWNWNVEFYLYVCFYIHQEGLWLQRGHSGALLNDEECLCQCSSGLSGCLMKITPHPGLQYFNQIWGEPDKCWIAALCSSLCPPLIPAGWIKPSCVTHSSSSRPSMDEKDIFFSLKPIKVTASLRHIWFCSSQAPRWDSGSGSTFSPPWCLSSPYSYSILSAPLSISPLGFRHMYQPFHVIY